jgi:CheY-like chemotaxis protein
MTQNPSKTILVVDDDAVLRTVIVRILSQRYNTLFAATGNEALDLLDDAGQPIGLMITDIAMPGIHGLALARMAVLRRPELKIIYVSGQPALADRDMSGTIGEVIAKPCRAEQLFAAVDRAFSA